MIVSYFNYDLRDMLFVDGANLYYDEISKLLAEQKYLNCECHNIRNILLGKEKLNLKQNDILINNLGPYAFVYHYLREKHGLDFSIIRDVQTSFWTGYIFQEKACEKYTREGDKVLFLSEFNRQLFIKIFPHLNEKNTLVCAPFMHFFPKTIKREPEDGFLTLGWVGRPTYEKNFHLVLKSFLEVKKEIENVRFLAVCGKCSWKTKEEILRGLIKKGIDKKSLTLLMNVEHNKVWDAYKKMDLFLFPSTSLNESLGRVMIEAAYCGIPVIAAHYAFAPQLLDKKNLLQVSYKEGLIDLVKEYPYHCGLIETDQLVKKILDYGRLSRKARLDLYKNHDRKFTNLLQGKQCKTKLTQLDSKTNELIENAEIYNNKLRLSPDLLFEKLKYFLLKENFYDNYLFHFFVSSHLKFYPYMQFSKSNRLKLLKDKTKMYLKNLNWLTNQSYRQDVFLLKKKNLSNPNY